LRKFQSHNGAIAASRKLSIYPIHPHSFNPTMVRLLRGDSGEKMRNYEKFQSHNGAIAAVGYNANPAEWDQVSIPQWCDCCDLLLIRLMRSLIVSIPQWCDCCPINAPEPINCYCLSIPQWCDCCGFNRYVLVLDKILSIPQWCDCCPKKPQ